jgi:hypothetical protein
MKRRIWIIIISQMFEYELSWHHRLLWNKFLDAIWQRAFEHLWFNIELPINRLRRWEYDPDAIGACVEAER